MPRPLHDQESSSAIELLIIGMTRTTRTQILIRMGCFLRHLILWNFIVSMFWKLWSLLHKSYFDSKNVILQINDSLCSHFDGKKGLRQGCPLFLHQKLSRDRFILPSIFVPPTKHISVLFLRLSCPRTLTKHNCYGTAIIVSPSLDKIDAIAKLNQLYS